MNAAQLTQLAIAFLGLGLLVSGLLDFRKRKKKSEQPGIGEYGQMIAGIAFLIFCLFVPLLLRAYFEQ